MSHKARKILTQDTLAKGKLEGLAQLIPSKSILVIVAPETMEPWDLQEEPQYEHMRVRELDTRRVIGGEAQRQIDYANWGWMESSSFRRPGVIVVPLTEYAVQTMGKLEFSGIIKHVVLPELGAFNHNGGWSGRHEQVIWGETRRSILAEHLDSSHGGCRINSKTTFQWYLEDVITALLKHLVEFEACDRLGPEQPLTFILSPVYAQLFAWAFAEMYRRTQDDFFGGVQDIINQPFYGCDAILVTPRGVSIMRSGWGPY
ncbi:hypothetical protein HY622_04120 [Candidatus Uhrbacteria bacterium]|nr:hypothetical protein [Candidatus Uhrbacteria bacterium]